ncbi:hypothetical protein CHLNCDRAFT_136136 [Chlorella variabilis]|uniref:SGNH hydrolase-type esterase domain-containing protein n=1 Tax=Chlorella variabilis TaxID=554065 RepID=E1ZJU6_CHLVA|nr:hypothetical protein CHLNCDRAFT_136136 [Chlorella variabilis]EFN53922.1 hypothetical protein CHLNCDRAFT_136136 [Chlorella variabilis]|eukprot:XP_005846024.1 hypothetical protein CHLNCDRAFT_136136 [Chlorella variabilis]
MFGTLTGLIKQRSAITNWEAFSRANNISGWKLAVPPCQWTGVGCNADGAITSLDLGCVDEVEGLCAVLAEGSLAPELVNVGTLESIFLQGQTLTGPLPEAWGAAGAFARLAYLSLANNDLTGSIPASWGGKDALAALELIQLSGNKLCGDVPAPLQPKLECADGDDSCSDGQLPACSTTVTALAADGEEEGSSKLEEQPEAAADCPPGDIQDVPSWAKKYNARIAAKEAAQEQAANNKALVAEANESGERYDFVMYGDSITWRVSENMGVWDRYLGSLGGPSAPLGIIFNQVSDLAYRIMNGDERFDLAPKAVALLIGVNNLERGPQPAEQLEELVKWLQAAWPSTRLILLNLLPTVFEVEAPYLDITGTNKKYQQIAEETGIEWSTCGSDIDPADEAQLYDGIHPGPKGVDILLSCLGPQVEAAVAAFEC